jgi:hypothetical protein
VPFEENRDGNFRFGGAKDKSWTREPFDNESQKLEEWPAAAVENSAGSVHGLWPV